MVYFSFSIHFYIFDSPTTSGFLIAIRWIIYFKFLSLFSKKLFSWKTIQRYSKMPVTNRCIPSSLDCLIRDMLLPFPTRSSSSHHFLLVFYLCYSEVQMQVNLNVLDTFEIINFYKFYLIYTLIKSYEIIMFLLLTI